MSMLKVSEKKYADGRTKQAFKDQCDVNKILKKAQVAGGLSHVQKYSEAVYGDFDGEFTLLDAQERIAKAGRIFADLPSEVRKEFGHNPLAFVSFAADPKNNDKLRELLPKIAEPGSYFPNPVKKGAKGAAAATAPEEPGEKPPEKPLEKPPEESAASAASASSST